MRIYIIDEGGGSGEALAALARRAGHEIEGYSTVAAFLETTAHTGYGCVLLDARRFDDRSIDLLDRLAARVPVWPVILLSETIGVDDAITAFRHGVLHCLRKPWRGTELDDVLGEAVAVAEARLVEYRRGAAALAIRLSQREREVMRALADGRPSKVIAWQLGVSVRTIDMHRSNILTKLGARNASQAVSIARQLGLLDTA